MLCLNEFSFLEVALHIVNCTCCTLWPLFHHHFVMPQCFKPRWRQKVISPSFVWNCAVHDCTGIKDRSREQIGNGPANFQVSGNVHHYIGIQPPEPGDKLGSLQMYIYDSEHEVYNRSISQPNNTLNEGLIQLLQDELDEFNVHVQMFRAFDLGGANADKYVILSSDTGALYHLTCCCF